MWRESGDQWENIEPVEEDNGERLNQVGPASEGGVYHKPNKLGKRDFSHQCQTSSFKTIIYYALIPAEEPISGFWEPQQPEI